VALAPQNTAHSPLTTWQAIVNEKKEERGEKEGEEAKEEKKEGGGRKRKRRRGIEEKRYDGNRENLDRGLRTLMIKF
jgi:hypothetical protein